MLVPPDSFGLVEDGVYRCAKLDPINYSFLETLNLKSLILLDPEKPARPFRNFLDDRGIKLFHLGGLESINDDNNPKMEDWMLLKPQIVGRIFEILFQSKNYNLLLIDKSETVIGILRQIQKWAFTSIINEYRLYSGNKSNYFSENFLELVSVELIAYEDESIKEVGDIDVPTTPSESEDIQRMKDHSIPIRKVHRNSFQSRRPDFSMDSLRNSLPSKSESPPTVNEDDMSLSVSPQIPKNLLRFAELRKQKKRLHHESSEEILPTSSTNFVRYYQPSNNWFHTRSRPTKVKLPPEDELPTWFCKQRDEWESEFSRLNC